MWQPQARLAGPRGGQFVWSPAVVPASQAAGLGVEGGCDAGHDSSQQPQFLRPSYSQANIRHSGGYPSGSGIPGPGVVHDMKPPFPQQSGLSSTAPGQQGSATGMVYTGQQHMPTRPPINANASSASMQQPHGGQYFNRSSGSTSSNAGATGAPAGSQSGNQSQPRHVQAGQRSMPLGMIPQPPGGAPNSQPSFFGGPPATPMFIQQPIGQQAIIYQHPMSHQSSLSAPVEFQSHPSHSSSARYTIQSQDNGDLGSPALRYSYPAQQYTQQPPTMYVQQPSPGYPVNTYQYQSVLNIHQPSARPAMVPPVPTTQTPYPKRAKNLIRIVDPKTLNDVTDDIMNNAGNNPTPPASGASSTRGTPPSNVATPPPPASVDSRAHEIAAQFARQVAAVASSPAPASGQTSASQSEVASPPQTCIAVPVSSNSVPLTSVTPAITSTISTTLNVSRTKSEKEFADNKSQEITDLKITEKQLSTLRTTSEDVQDENIVSARKETKVVPKTEMESISVGVKVIEKQEMPTRQPIVAASTTIIGPAPTIKKLDSAPSLPPPFTMAKTVSASDVNASVAPFGSMNPSLVGSSDKMSGTPPGSSQVIISAPLDYNPARESLVEHVSSAHHLSQGSMGTKGSAPVVPAPFTQQQGSGQQTSSRPPPATPGVDSGRMTGHHPPATPLPFSQQHHPQPLSQTHKQNGEVQPDTAKINVGENEVPVKEEKHQSSSNVPSTKKSRDIKGKNESKDIGIADLGENRTAPAAPAAVDEAPEIVITDETHGQRQPKDKEVNSVTSGVDGVAKPDEEMLDKETKRKNEENAKVSGMALDKSEMETPLISDHAPSNKQLSINLQLPYKEDQWSPINLDGKKQYDRDFLLKMQNQPPSLKKPEGLPDLEVIRDDVVNASIADRVLAANANKSRTGTVANDFVPVFMQQNNKVIASTVKLIALSAESRSLLDFNISVLVWYANIRIDDTKLKQNSQFRGRNSNSNRKEQPSQQLSKKISISLCQEVKLHDAENPWVPSYKLKEKFLDELETLYRKVRALLNKLTPNNFSKLMVQIDSFGIDAEIKLVGTIDLIFEKAIDEPGFSAAYAGMCQSLQAMKVQSSTSESVNFRKLIINRCQAEFEKDITDEMQQREERQRMINEADAEKKKILQEELEESIAKSKRRSLGNIRFIGELFKLKMLTGKIMHECVKKLLNDYDDASLECLCKLLTTIGKDLEFPTNLSNSNKGPPKPPQPDNRVAEYFQKIDEISQQTKSRARFMLLDLIDLRKSKWVPRRAESNPKTIDQIHREAEAEQQEKQFLYPSPMGKRNDDRVDRRGQNILGKRGSNESEGWTNVGSGGRKTSIPDTSKCRMRLDNLDENTIQFGPQISGWSKGSKGGKSSLEDDRSSSGANRYLLLSDSVPLDSRRPGAAPRQHLPSHSMPGRDRSMGGSVSQQLPISSHRSGGAYKPSTSMSREHEQAIANVKNISNNDNAGRPPLSIQKPPQSGGSRSSSISRESEREPQVKDMQQLESKIKNTIDEYLDSNNVADAVLNVTEEVPVDKMEFFVSEVASYILEKSSKARLQIGQLFCELVKKNKLTIDQFWNGMKEIFVMAEDLAIDVPKIWEYLAETIASMFIGETISLNSLKQVVEPQLGSKTSTLLAYLLKVAHNVSPIVFNKLWHASGFRLNQLVSDSEVEEFISRYKLEFLNDSRSSAVSFLSKERIIEGLKQELQSVSRVDNSEARIERETIFNWISVNVSEQQQKDPSFIRALVTAIADRSIKMKEHGSYDFDEKFFKSCCTVIKRNVDNKAPLELETLFALQSFVHKLEHPKGLLQHFFRELYNLEVISDDGFLAWKNAEGQEVEGHAVAVKAVNSFLSSFKQSEDEDSA